MSEKDAVLQALQEALAGGGGALATLVAVEGSAYRRVGARMVVRPDGSWAGTLSGGCLEGDVSEVAKATFKDGAARLVRYDMDEDLVWGLGLGCPGKIRILVEPLPRDGEEPLGRWAKVLAGESGALLARKIGEPDGRGRVEVLSLFIPEEGAPVGTLGDPSVDGNVLAIGPALLREVSAPSFWQAVTGPGGEVAQIFLDTALPGPEILVFGAGHDARPLVALARSLGFRTTVVDPRPAFLTEVYFPGAQLIQAQGDALKETVRISPRTVVVIMNHHILRDRDALGIALASEAPYIGLLGPKSRGDKTLTALKETGFVPPTGWDRRLFNPVGVDIGAETPEEIAVSALAEILAVASGRSGGFLKEHGGPLHPPVRSPGERGPGFQGRTKE